MTLPVQGGFHQVTEKSGGPFGFDEGLARDYFIERREHGVARDFAGGAGVILLVQFRFRRYFRQASTLSAPFTVRTFFSARNSRGTRDISKPLLR